MPSAQDVALTIARQADYGTPATTGWRSFEFLTEALDFRKQVNDSAALRYGSRMQSNRGRVIMATDGGGALSMELGNKNFGLWWEAILGAAVSTETAVDSDVFQQVFTPGDAVTALTVQKVLPSVNEDATFNDNAFTFDSCVVTEWTLTVPTAGIVTLNVTIDARDVTTATAKVEPIYAANDLVYTFLGASLFTGTLTPPTSTALASASTPVANVKSVEISGNNNLNVERYHFGSGGKKARPTRGRLAVTGSMTVEFASGGPFVAAFMQDLPMRLLLELRTTLATDAVQVALADVRLNGELPKANAGELIEMTVPFTAYADAGFTQPIWVVQRTVDPVL